MNGRPKPRSDVWHRRSARSPTGREPQGDGVLVVVGGGESPPQGEGGQARRHLKGRRVRDAHRPEPSGCRLTGELIDTETVTISSEGGGGKGRSRFPTRAYEPRHKPIPRQPPTLLQARFGRGGWRRTQPVTCQFRGTPGLRTPAQAV